MRALGLYLLSFIKKFRNRTPASRFAGPHAVITMGLAVSCNAYSLLNVIKVCHQSRRARDGRHGGADSRSRATSDGERSRASPSVLADKEREASDGHDGTWVAHPGLVPDRASRRSTNG